MPVKNYIDTQSFAEKKLIRAIIRRAERDKKHPNRLTQSEEKVLQAIMNKWFYYEHRTGVIYPGVPKLMRETGRSRRTVQMALRKFESLGFLIAIKTENQGRKHSTRYKIDILKLIQTYGVNLPKTMEGELVELLMNWPEPEAERAQIRGAKNDPELHPLRGAKIAPELLVSKHRSLGEIKTNVLAFPEGGAITLAACQKLSEESLSQEKEIGDV